MASISQHRLVRNGRTGWIYRLFGYRHHGIALSPSGISLLSPSSRHIPFSDLAAPLRPISILGRGAISIALKDADELVVAGLGRRAAVCFIDEANAHWTAHFRDQLCQVDAELQSLAEALRKLDHPDCYPAAFRIEPLLQRASRLLSGLPGTFPDGILTARQEKDLADVRRLQEAPAPRRKAAADIYMQQELEASSDFFDTIEKNPLTPEQRQAVVTDEEATLVLAGAGSGKTSVIVAKAAHLIRRGIRSPDQILLMAFGKDAASEMAERIEARTGESVDAMTFHALGYRILGQVEGTAPALAGEASDDRTFRALLRDILLTEIAPDRRLGALLLKWFSEFYRPYRSEWDFKTKDAYFQYVEAQELRALTGDRVRSFEELEIANWLYVNGIAYDYEPDYEHQLPGKGRKAYTPDFRLTESGIYIEHFGVRKSERPGGQTILTTAPYVDRDSYLDGMEWKRQVHADHGTTLIETYSYERVEGRLTDALAEKLAPFVDPDPMPRDQLFEQLSELGQIDGFTQVLGVFLRHFKSSGTTIAACHARVAATKDPARGQAFLQIFEPLLAAYQARLQGRIDFEDMIVRATDHVASGRFRSPYRHLLVDEFQDISVGRAKLLLALKEQHADACLFAVGDDWQSIYRFTGSDIHLMRSFGDEFGGDFAGAAGIHESVDLGRTFRSVDRIALPARRFVLKNPAQIEKQVIPAGTSTAQAITVTYYGRGQELSRLEGTLADIEASAEAGTSSVLLLGRYNFVRPENLSQLRKRFPKLSLKFLTVHRSKGLEADHVVILSAVSKRMGFPSEIVDDPLIDLVLPEPEDFDHAEERRLFYVALTRARQSVTILADMQRPSAFVRELVTEPDYGVKAFGDGIATVHYCHACGGRMIAQPTKNGSTIFACEHRFLCGARHRPCKTCKKDLPVADKMRPGKLICSCGADYEACPKCADGWLEERKGRYGTFLGCVNYPDCKGTRNLKR